MGDKLFETVVLTVTALIILVFGYFAIYVPGERHNQEIRAAQ